MLDNNFEQKLKDIYNGLTDEMLAKVKAGSLTAQEMNVIRQFLNDQGIDAIRTSGSKIDSLVNELPFTDVDDPPIRRVK